MKRQPLIIFAGLVGVLVAAGLGIFLVRKHHAQKLTAGGPIASAAGSTVAGASSDSTQVVALSPPTAKLEPAFWLDVLQPRAVHQALMDNAWLKETTEQPLGRGFLGPWAVFFGTRAQDIGASFNGRVLNLFMDALQTPYRVLWLSGETSAQVPVILVPEASSGTLAALDLLVGAAGKGGFSPQGCPEQATQEDADARVKAAPDAGTAVAQADASVDPDGGAGGVPPPAAGLATISRVILGDRALFVAHQGNKAFISMRPAAILQGMCLPAFTLPVGDSAAELGVSLEQNGRALQSLGVLLGMKGEARLKLGLNGTGFTPLGISAPGTQKASLAAGALDASLLKLIPERTGVFLTLNLALPEKLDVAAFQNALAGKPPAGKTVPRQIGVLWNPRGDASLPSEVAVVWSRAEDAAFIASIASRTHPLLPRTLCGHLVLASTQAVLNAMDSSCSGKSPSVASAAPPIVQGLQAPSSLGLNVNLGALLPQLLADGYDSQGKATTPGQPPPVPPHSAEIDTAQKQLEPLPFLHWQALVNDQGQWTPGGFRS